MPFGLTDAQFKILNELVIQPLKAQSLEVYIFGSRATGKHHTHSDVDIIFVVPKGKALPLGFVAKITEAVEESRFPFKVDLVNEDQLASSYREQVHASRVAV